MTWHTYFTNADTYTAVGHNTNSIRTQVRSDRQGWIDGQKHGAFQLLRAIACVPGMSASRDQTQQCTSDCAAESVSLIAYLHAGEDDRTTQHSLKE